MTVVARLEAILSANTRDFDRAMNESEGRMHKIAKVSGVAGLAIAGGIAVGLEKSVKASIEAQKAEARLTQAYKNAHVAIAPLRKQIDGLEASGRKLGFTDEETTTAMGSLITATHNQRQAARDLVVAQDLARFKGVSLTDSTKMLSMAMTGSQRAAKQLGITVSPVTKTYDDLKATMGKTIDANEKLQLAEAKLHDKQLTGIAVVDAVKEHVKGQAQAYSDTAAGAMESFKAQLQHIEVEVGNKLLPAMMKAVEWIKTNWPAISEVIKRVWATDIKPALDAMIGLIKSVVTVIRNNWGTIGPIVQAFAKVIETSLKVVVDIIKVVTALLRGDWSGAWKQAKQTVNDAIDAIKARIELAGAIGSGILKAVGALGSAMMAGLKQGFLAGVKDLEAAITGLFGKVIGWAEKALGIKSPSTVFHGIGQNAVKGFINGVGSMAGDLKSAVVKIAEHAATSLYHAAGGLIHGGAAHGSQQNRNIGQSMAAAYGWGSGAQWLNLDALWNQESGWSNTAKNKSSGAYGIPQALPPTKLPFAGQEAGGSSAAAQIAWGLNYIKGRYGNPIAAEAHEQSFGWYDKGGWLPQGLSMALNTTGSPERVISGNGDNVVIPVSIGGEHVATVIFDQLRRKAKVFENRNGRAAFGT